MPVFFILNIFCMFISEKIRQLHIVFSIDMRYILYRITM